MIVEQRIYTFGPGKVGACLDLLGKEGFPLAKEKLGQLLPAPFSPIK